MTIDIQFFFPIPVPSPLQLIREHGCPADSENGWQREKAQIRPHKGILSAHRSFVRTGRLFLTHAASGAHQHTSMDTSDQTIAVAAAAAADVAIDAVAV